MHMLTHTDELSGLESVRSANGRLSDVTWLYDDGGRLYQSLKAQGAPLMLGMRGTTIIWRMAGGGADGANMPARVADWMSRQPPSSAADSGSTAASAKASQGQTAATAAKQAVAR